MSEVIAYALLATLGIVLAIKLSIPFQIGVVTLVSALFYKETKGAGLEGVILIILYFIFMGGMVIGDLYYYNNFYHGNFRFDIGWLFRP